MNREVAVYALDDGLLTTVHGVVTHVRDGELTIRTTGPRGLRPGRRVVLRMRIGDQAYRGRATVAAVGDFVVRLRLLEPLAPTDRRSHARAEVVIRYLVRRLPPSGGAPTRHLSLVPEQSRWITEEVVLSATGMRAALPGEWRTGDRVELRLHVPGPAGGRHLVLHAEVVRSSSLTEPGDAVLRFVDVAPADRLELSEIVDRARLADFLDPDA